MQHRRDAGVLNDKAPWQLAGVGADAATIVDNEGVAILGVVVRWQTVAVIHRLGCTAQSQLDPTL